jgi:hypothetical protein
LIERLSIVYLVPIDKSLVLRYGFTSNTLYYILGPFVYIYIRRLIIEDPKPYFLSVPHFIPALAYLLYMVLHIGFYNDIISNTYLDVFGFTWQVSCVISIVVYLHYWFYGN